MKIEKIEKYDILIKKVFFFTFSIELLIRLIGIYSLLPSKVDTFMFTVTSFGSVVILFIDFFVLRKILVKKNILLIFFILALIISAIINGPQGLVANFKLIIWQITYLFVVFQLGKTKELYSSIITLEKMMMVIWNLLCIISISMFFVHFSYVAPLDKFYNGLRVGFVENRLYGVFADPNFAGVVSVVIILFSTYYVIEKKESRSIRLIGIISVLIQFIYIVLSGSRTAFIALIGVSFFGTFFIMYSKRKNGKKILSLFLGLATGLIVLSFIMGGEWVIKSSFPKIAQSISVETSIKSHLSNTGKKAKKNVTLTRDDVEHKDDVSNNRFELWQSSFEIFETTPIVGTSPRNMMDYAVEHLPHTFIATKQQTSHNFVFYLLATTGLLGTIPILLFIINVIFGSLKILLTDNNIKYNRFLLDNLVSLTILISACFLTELILVNKIGAFLFWLYLGKVSNVSDKFMKKRDVKYEAIER